MSAMELTNMHAFYDFQSFGAANLYLEVVRIVCIYCICIIDLIYSTIRESMNGN
jgi:hypothetical protein